MNGSLEYRVCQARNSRMTFVNGEWSGRFPFDTNDAAASMETCPWVWDYLAAAGRDGWELTAAVNHQSAGTTSITEIFLKRA